MKTSEELEANLLWCWCQALQKAQAYHSLLGSWFVFYVIRCYNRFGCEQSSSFCSPDHPLPKSPRSEEKRQKLNAGYSCKRCRYDLKQQQQQQNKTFINARKHQFQTLLLKFAEIIKPSNFNFQKPFYRANSTSFQSFRCLVSLSFESEVNAL